MNEKAANPNEHLQRQQKSVLHLKLLSVIVLAIRGAPCRTIGKNRLRTRLQRQLAYITTLQASIF
jgi:hypothetical protein